MVIVLDHSSFSIAPQALDVKAGQPDGSKAGLYFVSSARVRLMMALQGLGSQVPPKKEVG